MPSARPGVCSPPLQGGGHRVVPGCRDQLLPLLQIGVVMMWAPCLKHLPGAFKRCNMMLNTDVTVKYKSAMLMAMCIQEHKKGVR